MSSADESVRTMLRVALTEAMRSRDMPATSAYRTTLAALDNAEAVPVDTMPPAGAVEASAVGVGATEAARRDLSEDEQRALVASEADERHHAAREVDGHDTVRAARRRYEAALLEAVLGR